MANITSVLIALLGIYYGINDIIKKGKKSSLFILAIYSIILIPLMAIIQTFIVEVNKKK